MTLADHLIPFAEGIMTPIGHVRVRVTKDGETWFLTMRHDGEPINWPAELEALCGNRRPTFANLINAGFTISQAQEKE